MAVLINTKETMVMNPSYQKTSAKGSFSTLTLLAGLEHLGAPSPECPLIR